jgi:hypothetical protein
MESLLQGKQRLEALLERVSLSSDYKARKVLHIAADRGLNSVLTSTCKVSSTHFFLFFPVSRIRDILVPLTNGSGSCSFLQ